MAKASQLRSTGAIQCGKYFPLAPIIILSKGQLKIIYAELPQNIYTPDLPEMKGRKSKVMITPWEGELQKEILPIKGTLRLKGEKDDLITVLFKPE